MRSRTIQFKTIIVLILFIATTPLFAAKGESRDKKRGEKNRPQTRQQLHGDRNEKERPDRDFDGSAHGRGRDIDRMHPQVEGLIPAPVREKLKLTDEQKTQLAKIYKEQGERIKKLSKELLEIRQKLTEAIFEEANESEIRKIAGKMGSVIGDMAVIRSSGYAVLSDILSEKQFDIIAQFHEKHAKGAEEFQKRMKSQRREHSEAGERGRRQERGRGRERGEVEEHGKRQGRGQAGERSRDREHGKAGEHGSRSEHEDDDEHKDGDHDDGHEDGDHDK